MRRMPNCSGGSTIKLLNANKKLLLWILGEVAGVFLLVAFVLAVVSMPPLQVRPEPKALLGYTVNVDTETWGNRIEKYWETIKNGSLGEDYKKRPVGPLVAERLGNSMKLAGTAVLLATVLGVLKGFWDFNAMRKRAAAIGPILTSAVQGLPDFWLILMLQLGVAWVFKTTGWRPFRVGWSADDPYGSLALPLIALSLIPMAYISRITSTSMANVWDREYIRTARAKGLSDLKVVFKHALRNAVVQILDGLPGVMAVMVSNLLIVEYLFNYPGLTTLLKEAINPVASAGRGMMRFDADIPVLVAAGVSLGFIFSALYLVVNLLRRVADPRLKERDQA